MRSPRARRRLSDSYRVPGFRPLQTVVGIFGDPGAWRGMRGTPLRTRGRAAGSSALRTRSDTTLPAVSPLAAAISCGNKDGLINISQGVHGYLKERDVPHIWNVDDEGHTPKTWASNLYHFAQRIFR